MQVRDESQPTDPRRSRSPSPAGQTFLFQTGTLETMRAQRIRSVLLNPAFCSASFEHAPSPHVLMFWHLSNPRAPRDNRLDFEQSQVGQPPVFFRWYSPGLAQPYILSHHRGASRLVSKFALPRPHGIFFVSSASCSHNPPQRSYRLLPVRSYRSLAQPDAR